MLRVDPLKAKPTMSARRWMAKHSIILLTNSFQRKFWKQNFDKHLKENFWRKNFKRENEKVC
jgi:hypothetical protein